MSVATWKATSIIVHFNVVFFRFILGEIPGKKPFILIALFTDKFA